MPAIIEKINIHELKEGDLFSFRTIKRPIWWRFVDIKNDDLIYADIKGDFTYKTRTKLYIFSFVLRKTKIQPKDPVTKTIRAYENK